jgi:AcrR family transcriptional regulator
MAMTQYAGTGDAARTMALLWGTPSPRRRGRPQGIDVEEVVAAAIGIADAEGLGAVSMRRLADAVGVGTMSIYTYVRGKAELLEVMVDRAMADSPQPPRGPDWRADLEALTRSSWNLYRRHPWLLDVATARTVFGPNVLARYDAALATVNRSGLPPHDIVAVVSLLDGYVRGAARAVVDAEQATARTGQSEEDWWTSRAPLIDEHLAVGDFPTLVALGAAGAFEYPETGAAYMVQRAIDEFEFGLSRILDGIAVLVDRR